MTDFPSLLSGMEGAFYAAFGEPATYHAPGSVEGATCTVIRVGGGREITVGALRLTIDDIDVHVSRAALTPEPGATMTIGVPTWTVGAVDVGIVARIFGDWSCNAISLTHSEWFAYARLH